MDGWTLAHLMLTSDPIVHGYDGTRSWCKLCGADAEAGGAVIHADDCPSRDHLHPWDAPPSDEET